MSDLRTPPPANAAALSLQGISKSFDTGTPGGPALDMVELNVAAGEILALTGPSGAGKTTLCRIVAGLESPDEGRCRLAGRDVTELPPGRRNAALMFESYALYPHLTVRANVESPLRAPNGGLIRDPASLAVLVDGLLELLEIRHLADRLPSALSGGQKQRVALARTLVQEKASVTLFDEPISHLDAKLRHKLRGELRQRLVRRASPTIWSTPDGMEAMSVGDRVAVIDRGRIEQVGTPEDIWLRPASTRVARLIGDPPMNLLSGRLATAGGGVQFVRGALRLPIAPALARTAAAQPEETAVLGIRPDVLRLVPPDAAGAVAAELYSYEPFGKHAIATVRLDGALLKSKLVQPLEARIGETVHIALPSAGVMLFSEKTGLRHASPEEATGDSDRSLAVNA